MKNYTWTDKYGNGSFSTSAESDEEAEKYKNECLKDNGAGWRLDIVEEVSV